MTSRRSQFLAAFCSASLLAVAPASAAQAASPTAYSPWAAYSALASSGSSQALCGAAVTAIAASAAVQGTLGCVFPTVDAPVPSPIAETAPVATPAAVVAGGGVGILPLLVGLAALGGLAALLLANGDNGPDQISVSP